MIFGQLINISGEITFFKNQAENEAGTLFRDPRGHITKVNCIKLKFVDPVVRSIFIFWKRICD